LIANLNALEAQAKENDAKIQHTVAQIAQAKSDITQINIDMANISKEIIAKNKEIEDLGVQINAKDAETKQLMEFAQISSGDSFYLEYVMGAETMTDFIYRLSVTEQLSKYNSDLISQMNDMIKANEARKVELGKKTVELDQKQEQISKDLQVLADQKIKLDEYDRSLEDEIANARDVIKMYQDAGCKNYEDINVCANRILPSDTRFWRPFARGVVTSEFGYRPSFGDYHYAVDVSNSGSTKVYSVANGKVAKVFYDKYGGNQVVIHHKIISNGVVKYYSSTYCHLASVYVKDGTVVTKDTVIGIMGSTGTATGPHTHLAISNGLRYKDYVSYNDYIAHSFNPRNVINFPPKGVYWSDRVTRY
jgi:murein DD-endopeptidase MepM/ murein hydrolase activator NlpD